MDNMEYNNKDLNNLSRIHQQCSILRGDQRAALERAKLAQQQVAPRAGSGTPQIPGGYGRLDGNDERTETPGMEVKVERSASATESGL